MGRGRGGVAGERAGKSIVASNTHHEDPGSRAYLPQEVFEALDELERCLKQDRAAHGLIGQDLVDLVVQLRQGIILGFSPEGPGHARPSDAGAGDPGASASPSAWQTDDSESLRGRYWETRSPDCKS